MTRKKHQTDAGHMVDLSRIDPDTMYTRTEAGDLLGCSSSSIREYGRRDMLTEVRQGYFLRIAGADLIAIGKDINKAGGFKLWASKRQAESKSNTAVLSKDSIASGQLCRRCQIDLAYDPCDTDPCHCGYCAPIVARSKAGVAHA